MSGHWRGKRTVRRVGGRGVVSAVRRFCGDVSRQKRCVQAWDNRKPRLLLNRVRRCLPHEAFQPAEALRGKERPLQELLPVTGAVLGEWSFSGVGATSSAPLAWEDGEGKLRATQTTPTRRERQERRSGGGPSLLTAPAAHGALESNWAKGFGSAAGRAPGDELHQEAFVPSLDPSKGTLRMANECAM